MKPFITNVILAATVANFVLICPSGQTQTSKVMSRIQASAASGGIVSGGNGIYNVYVQNTTGNGVGMYTATTGSNHPAGGGLNVLFGSGLPGTSFNTIRSYTSHTDYIQRASGTSSTGNTVVSLDPYGSTVPLPLGTMGTPTGARTTYILPPNGSDALTIVQDVNVNGTTFADSTIEVTTRITNTGTTSEVIGARYLWDFQIGSDDGPTFQAIRPNGPVLVNETDFIVPTFESFQIVDNDGNANPPTFDVQGTITGPSRVVPAPTPPDFLQYVSWSGSFGTSFEYTTSSLNVASPPSDDSAGLYFFGHDMAHAITIAAGRTIVISASLFVTPPVPPALTLTPAASTSIVGQPHTVTASVASNNAPVAGSTVSFAVTGANAANGTCMTGTDGTCPFTYTGLNVGNDVITAQTFYGNQLLQATAAQTWIAQGISLHYLPSQTPETHIATAGQPTDQSANSMAITLAQVINPLTIAVTFHYEPTEQSAGHGGVGIADGICEVSLGATESNDFDCRLAKGGFVYQTLANGDQVVPHIVPSHNQMGVWVNATGTRVSDGMPAQAGVDYNGPVDWFYAWNSDPPLFPSPNPEYSFGWNHLNQQMFDRPGENPDIAFVKNITTFSKPCPNGCVGTNDPGSGGRTKSLNDIVVADPPNPPTGSVDVVEPLLPIPGNTPFQYVAGAPMLVAFELENPTTDKPDPNALVFPHTVSVAVLDPVTGLRQDVQTAPGFPTTFTYDKFFQVYYIFLSPNPYAIGTVFQLQISSDLFPKPVNRNFVVKRGKY